MSMGSSGTFSSFGFECRAGVTRRYIDPRDRIRFGQLPGQRVFAPATPHNQNIHMAVSLWFTDQCRKWRMPVNTMAMPASFAAAITSSSRMEPPG